MNRTPLLSLLMCLLVLTGLAHAQIDTVQNLLFKRKEITLAPGTVYLHPKQGAFYLYRNCFYQFELKGGGSLYFKVVDIKQDSIYYLRGYGSSFDDKDTQAIHPSAFRLIHLYQPESYFGGRRYWMKDYLYVFERDTAAKRFESYTRMVYTTDSSKSHYVERVGNLSYNGINFSEVDGLTHYHKGRSDTPLVALDTLPRDIRTRNWVWVSPTWANKVNGLNIGAQTCDLDFEMISVSGVNISLDLLSAIGSMFSVMYLGLGNKLSDQPDTVNLKDIRDHISGVSISCGGLWGEKLQVNGLIINGGVCEAIQSNGLVISGVQNMITEFRGIAIAGLRNAAARGRGLQIGLWNICKDLKGVQVGLWNVNSKRKFPLVNWNF